MLPAVTVCEWCRMTSDLDPTQFQWTSSLQMSQISHFFADLTTWDWMTFDLDVTFDLMNLWRFPCYIHWPSLVPIWFQLFFQMRPILHFWPILQLYLRWPLTLVCYLWPHQQMKDHRPPPLDLRSHNALQWITNVKHCFTSKLLEELLILNFYKHNYTAECGPLNSMQSYLQLSAIDATKCIAGNLWQLTWTLYTLLQI